MDVQEDREINNPMPEFLETQIYAAFVNADDSRMMEKFKNSDTEEIKYNISKNFSDPRLREIGYRIIYSENPQVFPKDKLKEGSRTKVLSTDDNVDMYN